MVDGYPVAGACSVVVDVGSLVPVPSSNPANLGVASLLEVLLIHVVFNFLAYLVKLSRRSKSASTDGFGAIEFMV